MADVSGSIFSGAAEFLILERKIAAYTPPGI